MSMEDKGFSSRNAGETGAATLRAAPEPDWDISQNVDGRLVVITPNAGADADGSYFDFVVVCTLTGHALESRRAALIRAAPDMLAALQALNECILGSAESNASGNPQWEYVSSRINAARAAILKAQGQV